MATARTRTTKPSSPAVSEPQEDDDAPSFTTPKPGAVVYDGPVLFRLDGRPVRMRSERSFNASLVYLRQLGDNATGRQAEFALLDYVVGRAATDGLIRAAELEPAKWTGVVNRALTHVLGKLKEDSGN